jgi:pyridoxine/pyridoxamine 5'-phosphate oxidase
MSAWRMTTPMLEESETDGTDPARALSAAMQDASLKMSRLSGDGVKVATCNPDGTADVRMVSNEDFIAGKALDGER